LAINPHETLNESASMSQMPIYLDYNATTPIDPAVRDAMLPCLGGIVPGSRDFGQFGNPSSTHAYGRSAHDAIHHARGQVAALLGAKPNEIVFTGGGTEASNHAIKGVAFRNMSGFFARWRSAPHLITCAVEHPATLEPCKFLERLGCKVTVLPVDRFGMVDPDDVRKAITRHTFLVSIMHANNEVGTLQPIADIGRITRERGVLLHTDAAQSLGKVAVVVDELSVDLFTVAGHKLYAPKGVGVLYVRDGVKLDSFLHGAGHEGGRRAGTENTPYIVGLGKACEIARQSLPEATRRLRDLRDRLWSRLHAALGDKISLNGHPESRLPNTLNVNFVGQVGADFLAGIPEIAASTGSACHEGSVTQSPVLCAMRVPPEIGKGAVRLSVGRFTTEDEIDRAAELMLKRF
jgi:cysteine desulfurase